MIFRPTRLARPVQGRSGRPRACGVIRSASSSPSRSRNSQRVPVAGDLHEGGGPDGVADLLHAVPRVEARIVRMPMTSQRSVKPRPSKVIPASSRMVLLQPSQPSTAGPVNVRRTPATRACTRTGAPVSGPRAPSSPNTSPPRRKSISGCSPTRASSSSSRSGWWNMLACGKPCTPGRRSRRNSAITRCLASSRRSPQLRGSWPAPGPAAATAPSLVAGADPARVREALCASLSAGDAPFGSGRFDSGAWSGCSARRKRELAAKET